jgi:hypothetical protein
MLAVLRQGPYDPAELIGAIVVVVRSAYAAYTWLKQHRKKQAPLPRS